jgi:hypothetical protein
MLYKVVDLGSFYPDDETNVRIVTPGHPVQGLVKSAAQKDIDDFVMSKLTPEPGRIYLHVNAMGAGEYYGSNKNGDYFPEDQLIKYHKTFEEHGYVYRHHVNHDPANSIGRVIFSTYNPVMHRVEVIEYVETAKAPDIVDRIARGDYPLTSMACKTPWDECSICGNRARTVKAYCDHLRKEMNRLHPDGRKTMALNLAPLKFFDMSVVLRPADVTSSVLRKVASAYVVPGAILGEEAGLHLEDDAPSPSSAFVIKQAAFKKIADLVKRVPGGEVMAADPHLEKLLADIKPMPAGSASRLMSFGGFNQVMNALADAKLVPPLEFFVELLAKAQGRPDPASDAILVSKILPMVSWSDLPAAAADKVPEVTEEQPNEWIMREVAPFMGCSSAKTECVEKRAYFPQDLPWGYTPPPGALYGSNYPAPGPDTMINASLMDHLLSLAGGAIVARFLLHSLVASKSRLQSGYGGYQVKQASDSPVTNKILEASLVRDLSRLKPVSHTRTL